MSYGFAARQGGIWGMRLGSIFGPLGAAVGAVAGAAVGVGVRAAAGYLTSQVLADQMDNADKSAEEELNETEDEGACTKCGMTQEEQEERQRELENEAGVEQRTKGRTKHGERQGGMRQADEDFDSLAPDGIRGIDTIYGPGRTGQLKNGDRITVRPGSSEGPPTLEIRRPNGRGIEIRYPNFGS